MPEILYNREKFWGRCLSEPLLQPVSQTRQALVLTALPVEYNAVRAHLSCPSERVHPQGTVYECGRFAGPDGAEWDLAIAQIGAGNAHAAMEAERAIAFFTYAASEHCRNKEAVIAFLDALTAITPRAAPLAADETVIPLDEKIALSRHSHSR
jgi:hypothetical protein